MSIKIKWLGTAGFEIKTDQARFLIDPYLTRNENARPKQLLCPEDMKNIDMIFVSHGHFDHTYDIQSIAINTGAKVFCCETTKEWLVRKGVDNKQVHSFPDLKKIESLIDKNPPANGILYEFSEKDVFAQAFYSHHVEFDKTLSEETMKRILEGRKEALEEGMRLILEYPEGQPVSWRFTINNTVIHHFGSGGSTLAELIPLIHEKTDVLLVPLQGHTSICDIAYLYVKMLHPKMVIPQHHDDFFPPISKHIDIKPFIDRVKTAFPEIEVREMQMNDEISL